LAVRIEQEPPVRVEHEVLGVEGQREREVLAPDVFRLRVLLLCALRDPRHGFEVSDFDETTGAWSRMRYDFVGQFALVAGAPFDIEVDVGYERLMGSGPPQSYTLRLTCYVPEEAMTVPMAKLGTQSFRCLAYPMPRSIALADLGLETAVTPWLASNRVRLLPPGSSPWTKYQYNSIGGYWYDVLVPGAPANLTIQAGMGIVFLRHGPPDADDMLVLPTWYTQPPND
jgi:hypothetical protein